jgi:hypothetical protein
MRAIAMARLAGLMSVLVLPLGACSKTGHVNHVKAMQAWIESCESDPTDEGALEKIAIGYGLEPFSLPEIGGLKKHVVVDPEVDPDLQGSERPFVSTVEAWWVDPAIGSYVEVVEWTRVVHRRSETVSKTYRSCTAHGTSQSSQGFTEEVHLDPTAGYGFRATKDKSVAWVGTIDGAHPEFYVDFSRKGMSTNFDRLDREAPAAQDVSLAAGINRVSQTVGWPAQWLFTASGEAH